VPRLKDLWLYFLGLPKTLRFNLKYFPLRTALRLPVFISHRVWFRKLRGTVRLPEKIRRGLVRIGFSDNWLFDRNQRGTILELNGSILFEGRADIGHGSRLIVLASGDLVIGPGFRAAAATSIICAHRVRFGASCLLSWDTLIMDTDFHSIFNDTGQRGNQDAEVVIGPRVWIGCRSTILKGTSIGSDSVVGAGSVVRGRFNEPNQVLAGNPARVVREGISWQA
jgi:acetyltransferase-like isoleucine patch superfamily enzyme